MLLFRVSQRLFNTPLFLQPDKADAIMWALRTRLGSSFQLPASAANPSDEDFLSSAFVGSRRRSDGTYSLAKRTADGTAIIRVEGSLVNRGAWIDADSGLTSYEGIAAQVQAAAADPEVTRIILDVDSPGGEATGMFTLAEAVRAARANKRVVAVVNDVAASAAYGIASGADEIVVSPTSMVGSIGVVYLHLDMSGNMKQEGIKPTLIFAGAHKVDGNPFGPLSDEVRASLEKTVMKFYDQFLGAVAAGRPSKTSVKIARATEARVFIGQDAITAGLADRIGTLESVLSEPAKGPTPAGRRGANRMDTSNPPAAIDTVSIAAHFKAINDARAEATTAAQAVAASQLAAATAAATTAERERIMGILSCKEAEGKLSSAIVLAGKGVSVEMATDLLKTFSAAAPAAPASLEQRMAGRGESPLSGNPPAEATAGAAQADRVKAGWSAATAQANKVFGL